MKKKINKPYIVSTIDMYNLQVAATNLAREREDKPILRKNLTKSLNFFKSRKRKLTNLLRGN